MLRSAGLSRDIDCNDRNESVSISNAAIHDVAASSGATVTTRRGRGTHSGLAVGTPRAETFLSSSWMYGFSVALWEHNVNALS